MVSINILLSLIAAHFLCDYPLQGDFLARGKNHKAPIPGVPWYQCLIAHAGIHGGAVGLILSWPFGVTEFAAHLVTDYLKCDGKLSFNQDQLVHLATKAVLLAIYFR